MIRLITRWEGRPLLLLGITQDNVDHLAAGHPMDFEVGELDGPIRVVMIYGADEQAIARELEKHGILPGGAQQRVEDAMKDGQGTQEFLVQRGRAGPEGMVGPIPY